MFAGHFGLAAAVKAKEPQIPVWALLVSTQLLDIAFLPMLLVGAESIEPIGNGGYGEQIIHAVYTHSLVGALVLSLAAALLAWRQWGKRSAVVIGTLSFSHWLLDLIVHRSDMPILPGNLGGLPLLGFRLWELPAFSATIEAGLIVAGALLYFRLVLARSGRSRVADPQAKAASRTRAYLAGGAMALFLLLCFTTDYIGL